MAKTTFVPDSKSKTGYSKQNTPRFNEVKFIKRELTADEQAELKLRVYTPDDFANDLDKYSEEYKFTFKYDSYARCYSVFVAPLDAQHVNAGYILTGRGSSCLKAFKQALYKHIALAGDEAWLTLDGTYSADIDD